MNAKVKPDYAIETTVERESLLRAAKLCATVADAKSPIVSYQSALIRIAVAGCDLTATSGAVAVRSVVGLEAKGNVASLCVNAKRLQEVVARMPDGWLQIKSGERDVRISSGPGRASVTLATTPAADFPTPIFPDRLDMKNIDRPALVTALRAVTFVVLLNDAGHDSVYLDVTSGRLSAWALNGHRFGIARMASDGADALSSLHVNAANAFVSVLESSDDPYAGLAIGEQISAHAAGTTITTRSTGASRPPWEEIVPADPRFFSVERATVLDAIGRAGMFATKGNPAVFIDVSADGLTVHDSGKDGGGEAQTTVVVDGDVKPVEIACSWRYLRDAIQACDSEHVDIAAAGQFEPIVVRPRGVTDGQMYLVMPMLRSKT